MGGDRGENKEAKVAVGAGQRGSGWEAHSETKKKNGGCAALWPVIRLTVSWKKKR